MSENSDLLNSEHKKRILLFCNFFEKMLINLFVEKKSSLEEI